MCPTRRKAKRAQQPKDHANATILLEISPTLRGDGGWQENADGRQPGRYRPLYTCKAFSARNKGNLQWRPTMAKPAWMARYRSKDSCPARRRVSCLRDTAYPGYRGILHFDGTQTKPLEGSLDPSRKKACRMGSCGLHFHHERMHSPISISVALLNTGFPSIIGKKRMARLLVLHGCTTTTEAVRQRVPGTLGVVYFSSPPVVAAEFSAMFCGLSGFEWHD